MNGDKEMLDSKVASVDAHLVPSETLTNTNQGVVDAEGVPIEELHHGVEILEEESKKLGKFAFFRTKEFWIVLALG